MQNKAYLHPKILIIKAWATILGFWQNLQKQLAYGKIQTSRYEWNSINLIFANQ
jgi:hypothetical protein